MIKRKSRDRSVNVFSSLDLKTDKRPSQNKSILEVIDPDRPLGPAKIIIEEDHSNARAPHEPYKVTVTTRDVLSSRHYKLESERKGHTISEGLDIKNKLLTDKRKALI